MTGVYPKVYNKNGHPHSMMIQALLNRLVFTCYFQGTDTADINQLYY